MMQDNERVFAFHAKKAGNFSKHLYHSKCLYSAWKKKKTSVGLCPSCHRLNPNQAPKPNQKNHAAICILADKLDEDAIDERLSSWIPNLKPENSNELISEFVAAADSQEKHHLIIPFVKIMLKKKIMKLGRQQHIGAIVRKTIGFFC